MVAFASCSRASLVEKVPVLFERPQRTYEVECDRSFQLHFPEMLDAFDIQIVADSILVIQNLPSEALQENFIAYSVRASRMLGAFLPNGRGPGEMLRPRIEKNAAGRALLGLYDSSRGLSWQVDVMHSIQTGTGASDRTIRMPETALSILQVSDSLHLANCLVQKKLLFLSLTPDGMIQHSFPQYGKLDCERFITHLSDLPTSNGVDGKVADFLVCFPELHILDTKTGAMQVIAVDKRWRKWESLLHEPFNMDKLQFYVGATSSRDYIFASFWGCRMEDGLIAGHGASVHVFDWDGNYLYNFKVKEDIENITFDSQSQHLYGLERSSGRIYRYDLSSLL